MFLISIEFQIISSGQTYLTKVVGLNERDIIQDLVSQVGEISLLSVYHQSKVDRITGTIRKKIIEQSISKEPTRGKGRPKKYCIY